MGADVVGMAVAATGLVAGQDGSGLLVQDRGEARGGVLDRGVHATLNASWAARDGDAQTVGLSIAILKALDT